MLTSVEICFYLIGYTRGGIRVKSCCLCESSWSFRTIDFILFNVSVSRWLQKYKAKLDVSRRCQKYTGTGYAEEALMHIIHSNSQFIWGIFNGLCLKLSSRACWSYCADWFRLTSLLYKNTLLLIWRFISIINT